MEFVLEEVYNFDGNLLILVDLIDSLFDNIVVLKPVDNIKYFSELFSIETTAYLGFGDCFFLPEEVFQLFLKKRTSRSYSIAASTWDLIIDHQDFYRSLKQIILKGSNVLVRKNFKFIGEVNISEIDLLRIEPISNLMYTSLDND